MHSRSANKLCLAAVAALILAIPTFVRAEGDSATFNVRDYGATGNKADNAQRAIQSAIDACAKAGGGRVFVPPGNYTTGTLFLRSHIRFFVEAGATLYASKDHSIYSLPEPYTGRKDKGWLNSIFMGVDLEDISI